MTDIVREAQGAHLCALFIKAHGDTGDYEYEHSIGIRKGPMK
ncbi:hypothetical protein [Corynebacterium sp. HMSC078A10]|nr:hypothetical protein [Corynebacterium sp. HMSC078A10]